MHMASPTTMSAEIFDPLPLLLPHPGWLKRRRVHQRSGGLSFSPLICTYNSAAFAWVMTYCSLKSRACERRDDILSRLTADDTRFTTVSQRHNTRICVDDNLLFVSSDTASVAKPGARRRARPGRNCSPQFATSSGCGGRRAARLHLLDNCVERGTGQTWWTVAFNRLQVVVNLSTASVP